jgi:F-type H+-transporting ATPase subunit delta
MPRTASARRYAQAAFLIASEKNELESWLDDLTVLAGAVHDGEFAAFLDAPQVSIEQKQAVIQSALSETVGSLPLNLIALLASRNLAGILPAIVEWYQRLLDDHNGIERAEVVSAVELDDVQRALVVGLLRRVVDKEIRLTSRVEPRLIGGLVARVGDHVIDGSTATRLESMRRELVERRR